MLDRDGNPQKEEVEITIPAFRAVSVFDVSQTDGKESILLIQNADLSEFSLLDVYGMDRQGLMQAFSAMAEDDKLSIAAYLESKGHGLRNEDGGENDKSYKGKCKGQDGYNMGEVYADG